MTQNSRSEREGQRVVVTGGSSGIGAATAEHFRANGAIVELIDRTPSGPAGPAIVADVSNAAELAEAMDEAVSRLGGIDVLVACAGIAAPGAILDIDEADWDRVFAVNTKGVFLSMKAALPHMIAAGTGVIVVVASEHGLVAVPNNAAYCASKAAVLHLMRTTAMDYASQGVRVTAVCPGATDTPLMRQAFDASGDPDSARAAAEGQQLHGRLVQSEEIAEAIFFLASPAAASIIGEALVVDGGLVLGPANNVY